MTQIFHQISCYFSIRAQWFRLVFMMDVEALDCILTGGGSTVVTYIHEIFHEAEHNFYFYIESKKRRQCSCIEDNIRANARHQ